MPRAVLLPSPYSPIFFPPFLWEQVSLCKISNNFFVIGKSPFGLLAYYCFSASTTYTWHVRSQIVVRFSRDWIFLHVLLSLNALEWQIRGRTRILPSVSQSGCKFLYCKAFCLSDCNLSFEMLQLGFVWKHGSVIILEVVSYFCLPPLIFCKVLPLMAIRSYILTSLNNYLGFVWETVVFLQCLGPDYIAPGSRERVLPWTFLSCYVHC